MVVNVEKVLKMAENGDFFKICQKMVKCWKMLVKTLQNKFFAVIFFYTMDIKNTIFNPKFYQHFLPSLVITMGVRCTGEWEAFSVQNFEG